MLTTPEHYLLRVPTSPSFAIAMLSAIGPATHLQLRVAGARLAAPIARKAVAPVASVRRTTFHGTVVVRRGFVVTRICPAAAAAEGSAQSTKKSATKKPSAKKSAPKKKPSAQKKKPAAKKKKPVAKKKPVKKVLSETAKKALVRGALSDLRRLALYGEEPKAAPRDAWTVFLSQHLKSFSGSSVSELAQQFRNMSGPERAVSIFRKSQGA